MASEVRTHSLTGPTLNEVREAFERLDPSLCGTNCSYDVWSKVQNVFKGLSFLFSSFFFLSKFLSLFRF